MRAEPACAPSVVRVASERSQGGDAWRSARLAVWSSRVPPPGDRSDATHGRRAGCAGSASRLSGLVLLGCVLASNLFAQSSGDTARQAEKVSQRVAQHKAEVQHLQQDVSQQESASQQAAERLEQQDRTIAELRRQLKAAQGSAKTPATGH